MSLADVQWDQVGVGVAALIALIIIVRIMRSQTDKLLRHTEETTDKVLTFFGNHMSETVRQQADVGDALRSVAGELKDLKDEIREDRQSR